MSVEIETIKPVSAVRETVLENVLIRKRVLNASKYEKKVIQFAQKRANDYYQQAIIEKETIQQIAYQHGYNDGIKQLLTDFIEGLNKSEITFQKQVNQSEAKLEKLLVDLFSDIRLKQIIAHYFLHQQENANNIQLHIPVEIQPLLDKQYSKVKIQTHSNCDTIALEADNEICYFSPSVAAKNSLPQILSISSRCQVLAQHKASYQQFIELLNTTRGEHGSPDK
ncbi:hypothetical protein [Providencia rettgeri]|uniref:hypothetical protein n=1 Tax=Providencia rettgeri TaxID=587 RepID=UPI0034E0C163